MRKWLQQNPQRTWTPLLALLWLSLLVFAAVVAGLLPQQLLSPDLLNSNAPPSTPGHWLGTDPQGQDVMAALLSGARTALLVSIPSVGIAAALGTGFGLAAGYFGDTRLRYPLAYCATVGCTFLCFALFKTSFSWLLLLILLALSVGKALTRFRFWSRRIALPLDQLIQVCISLLSSVPRLLLIITIAAAIEPTLLGLVLLLGFTSWTQTARLVRAEAKRVRQLPYLEAAHAAGLPPLRIIWHHMLPNVMRPVVTTIPLSIAAFITLETTLSFLGIGLPPEVVSWGKLLALSRLSPSSWWLLLFPALCLLATTLALRSVLDFKKR
jgi:peptide/nickel transport system permease protein